MSLVVNCDLLGAPPFEYLRRGVSKQELRELKIERDDFHGDWNYVIRPRTKMPSPTDSPIRGP